MAIGIGENLGKSFGFAKENLVGKWLNWLLLIILTFIPILDIIALGIYLRIFRGEKPEVNSIGKGFIDGLLLFVITFIYMIVPVIVIFIFGTLNLGLVGTIIGIILTILVYLIYVPASYNFANKGFGAAFKFGEIFAKIGKIGWGQYILSVIVVGIILALITGILSFIPIIGAILLLILMPALCIFSNKFYANLLA